MAEHMFYTFGFDSFIHKTRNNTLWKNIVGLCSITNIDQKSSFNVKQQQRQW